MVGCIMNMPLFSPLITSYIAVRSLAPGTHETCVRAMASERARIYARSQRTRFSSRSRATIPRIARRRWIENSESNGEREGRCKRAYGREGEKGEIVRAKCEIGVRIFRRLDLSSLLSVSKSYTTAGSRGGVCIF